jgi:nucleotidyltransferase/DNA polymerase involved in DNA repair
MKDSRSLTDLISVGPAMRRDFERLGVHSVRELARRNPEKLYEQLCVVTGQRHDICCLDVFCAAVAQARNPRVPAVQRNWWYWSRRRKGRDKARSAGSGRKK